MIDDSNGVSSRNSLIKHVLTLMSGTTLALAIPLLLSPLLARLYSPEQFGVFGLFIAFVGLGVVIANLRYDQAIVLTKHLKYSVNILVLCIAICSVIAIFFALLISLFRAELAVLMGDPELSEYLRFAFICVFLLALYQSLSMWQIKQKRFNKVAQAKVLQSTFINIFHVTFGFLNYGVTGLIVGLMAGQFFSVIYLAKSSNFKRYKKAISKSRILAVAKRYRDFPIFNSWSVILQTASVQLPIIFIGLVFSVQFAGFYYMAQRVVFAPCFIAGAAISQVYYREVTNYATNVQKVGQVSFSLYKKLLIFAALIAVVLVYFGEWFFVLIFGEAWLTAGTLAKVLSPWILFVFAMSPFSNLYSVLEKQKQGLVFNIFVFIARVASLVLAYVIFNDAIKTVLVFSTVSALLWSIQGIYLFSIVKVSIFKYITFTLMIVSIVYLPLLFIS